MANRSYTLPTLADPPNGPAQMQAITDDLVRVAWDSQGSAVPVDGDGAEGDYYWRTTTGVLYRHNGTGWFAVNPADAAAGTASLRTLGKTSGKAADGTLVSYLADDETFAGRKTFAKSLRHGVNIMGGGVVNLDAGKIQVGYPGQSYSVPAGTIGDEVEVFCSDVAGSLTLTRTGTNTINGATSISVPAGFTARLRFITADTWIAEIVGNVKPATAADTRADQWHTLKTFSAVLNSALPGGADYFFPSNGASPIALSGGDLGSVDFFQFDPQDWKDLCSAATKPYMRVIGSVLANATDPWAGSGSTVLSYYAPYSITAAAGGSGIVTLSSGAQMSGVSGVQFLNSDVPAGSGGPAFKAGAASDISGQGNGGRLLGMALNLGSTPATNTKVIITAAVQIKIA